MNAGVQTDDKRSAPRLRSLKGARLVVAQTSTFQCTVRNISSTGLCVEMPSTLAIPGRVELRMDDGTPSRVCEVAWRTETRLGLRYVA
jgi:hypothetical protein